MTIRVPLADLDYGVEEEEAVVRVLRSRWLTMGEVTQEFEQRFAELLGVRHAVAVCNGTAALHLACAGLEIGPGDEVIVPSLTFVASANAVLYTGAKVVFADIIGPDELNISPESIERAITSRTKAIMVVHYAGFPCRMQAIMELASRHSLRVIEDAAHAPGAALDDKALGCWGKAGCFSFFSNKNMTVGEGGMVVTGDDDLAARLRLLRSHGMTTVTWQRHLGHANSYDVVDRGYNYRIDEIRSALGVVQLEKLQRNNARRKETTERYRRLLADHDLGLPFTDSPGEPAYHIFPVLLPPAVDRNQVMAKLREEGMQTSVHYPPVHTFSHFRKHYGDSSLPRTEDAAGRELTLPLYPAMTDDDVDLVVGALTRAVPAARQR